MKLEKLISGITTNHIIGETSIEISGINIDSRAIEEGHAFVAVKGTQIDGHTFIDKAIEKGASTIHRAISPPQKERAGQDPPLQSHNEPCSAVGANCVRPPRRVCVRR